MSMEVMKKYKITLNISKLCQLGKKNTTAIVNIKNSYVTIK